MKTRWRALGDRYRSVDPADSVSTAWVNPLFNLVVTVDDSNLNLIVSHGALEPKPVGCAFGASGQSPAIIYAECSANQGA
jgi:hypothetical protein